MTRLRLLVTGATGFVGSHVASACAPGGAFENWEFHPAPKGLDLRHAEAVSSWVAAAAGDAVLHLAAQSFVPRSFADPRETLEINLFGTLNLLQGLKDAGFRGRFLYASSGDVYGQVAEDDLPVSEATPPHPRSPYAVSKMAAEHLCLQMFRSDGLDVVVGRPFNHIGPGQDRRFAVPAFARQIVAIAEGRRDPVMEVGDLDTTRDFTDVRDIVAAYAAMMRHGIPGGIYVIGSGQERSLREMLDRLCALQGISPDICQDPARLRPSEQRRMAADPSRLRADTGWEPVIPLDSTLQDILKDARQNP